MTKAIFIDKDGTLVEDIPYNVDADRIRFTEGAFNALKMLKHEGYLLILVSNQSGIAHGYFSEQAFETHKCRLQELLKEAGADLDAIFTCPHHPQGIIPKYAVSCDCRKPRPGMIMRAAELFDIDLSHSWMIGDILNDVEAGNSAGCRTILIDNGNETQWLLSQERTPTAAAKNLAEAASIIIHQWQTV
jgi:D-glycero-D-manno-heptose 1,7-bisphosphate phosphatase